MHFLSVSFTLPISDPVLKFLIILIIILMAPLLLNKVKIPHLIGLIIAGAAIGPKGFNLVLRDSSIIMSGTAGLLYIMFLAGLEMDLDDFKKNGKRSVVFGLYTFIIPMVLGYFVAVYVFKFSTLSSVLLASMFASHTLLTYPIISKLGVSRNPAVGITVGGTIITDTLALLILTIIVGLSAGEVDSRFWIQLGASILIFGLIVILIFPIIARWFFKWSSDGISQYIFVLAMIFLGAYLAQLAGLEAIIGSFFTGMVLNRLIARPSPLMNRVEFVGNAIFIPFFLIGVGMLIDYRSFYTSFETIKVGVIMIIVAIVAKYIAAWITQKTYKLSVDQRRIIFGLSNSQAAATLAAVTIGYNIILGQTAEGEPIRLLNDSVLNGTILMILVTCTVSSFVTQRGAYNIALAEISGQSNDSTEKEREKENILISVSNEDTVEELVNLSLYMKSKKNVDQLYALHVMENYSADKQKFKHAQKILHKANNIVVAAGFNMQQLLRYDRSVAESIFSVVMEYKISDLILGLHKEKVISTSFLGQITEGILNESDINTFIYRSVQPLSTTKRHLVIIPNKAEKEVGFPFYIKHIWNVIQNTGSKACFYCSSVVMDEVKAVLAKQAKDIEHVDFTNWDDFLIIARDVRKDDNLWIVLSRNNQPSFQTAMNRIPEYLDKYFAPNGFILIYPAQADVDKFSI